MLAYIQQFTDDHICQFWFPFARRRTVCRMYIGLENKGVNIFKVSCDSENSPEGHAEVIAYKKIYSELISELNKHKKYLNSESKLDFAIATNNSPCDDCKRTITSWIENLIMLMNGAHLQLTLFFSHLYIKEDEGSVNTTVVSFTDWIVKLVDIYNLVLATSC